MNRDDKRAQRREERRQRNQTGDPAAAVPAGAMDSARSEAPSARERTAPTQFMREVRSELRKVAWPTRNEVVNYTIVVLVVTLVLTLITFGMDFVLRELMLQVTN